MTGQSWAALHVPYMKEKRKWQKKTISFKIYLLFHFSSNLAQIFRKCFLHYNEKNVTCEFK